MSGLTAQDLYATFQKYPFLLTHFEGFHLPNTVNLSNLKDGNFCLIFLPHEKKSCHGHWNVIYKNYETIEHFDSLGYENARHKRLFSNLRRTHDVLSVLNPLQTNDETNCGHFCTFFIFHRLLNSDLDLIELLEKLFPPSKKPGQIVNSFFKLL